MSPEAFYKLSHLYLTWNMSNKAQRFGQYIESNSDWELGQELYESDDSYYVYSEVATLIEKGVLK